MNKALFSCDRCGHKILLPENASYDQRECAKCGARYQLAEPATPSTITSPGDRVSSTYRWSWPIWATWFVLFAVVAGYQTADNFDPLLLLVLGLYGSSVIYIPWYIVRRLGWQYREQRPIGLTITGYTLGWSGLGLIIDAAASHLWTIINWHNTFSFAIGSQGSFPAAWAAAGVLGIFLLRRNRPAYLITVACSAGLLAVLAAAWITTNKNVTSTSLSTTDAIASGMLVAVLLLIFGLLIMAWPRMKSVYEMRTSRGKLPPVLSNLPITLAVLAGVGCGVGTVLWFQEPISAGTISAPQTKSLSGQTGSESQITPKGTISRAIVDLAEQLQQHPSMQAYVLANGMIEGDDEVLVIQNEASNAIYENIHSPSVLRQLAEHTGPEPFEVSIHSAPGNLVEMTTDGIAIFDRALKQAGVAEGYRSDVLYLLTRNTSLSGRDEILSAAARLTLGDD